jgi:hypothetical protein
MQDDGGSRRSHVTQTEGLWHESSSWTLLSEVEEIGELGGLWCQTGSESEPKSEVVFVSKSGVAVGRVGG